MTSPTDRRSLLARQNALNGIDFVEILNAAQTRLRVHFINPVPAADALAADITAATITGGDSIPDVAVLPWSSTAWRTDAAGRPTLDLAVAAPGDFSTYRLRLTGALLDRYFDRVAFSFKARCESTLDCEPPEPGCGDQRGDRPPIDYLAKDFDSFRRALSEFSALRYPAWHERSEADFGVMFMEALASVADDLSYQQDRIAAEGWLETATERRSLVRLARLVDYEPRVATAARVWLQLEIAAGAGGTLPAGIGVSAQDPDQGAIEFETGTGLRDRTEYRVDPRWNRGRTDGALGLPPYWWDDSQRCLPPGSTEMWIEGAGLGLAAGDRLVLDTATDPPVAAPVREIVQLTAVDELRDPLNGNAWVTHVVWSAADALRSAHDLTHTQVAGNIVPATQGRRFVDRFVTSDDWRFQAGNALPRAIVRTGANDTLQFLHSLRVWPLAWLAERERADAAVPELVVVELDGDRRREWHWHPSLLTADAFEPAFTLDPARYRRLDAEPGFAEYDADDGDTIRFGDGVFGPIPADRAVFEVTYRSGGGARGNVAAGAIDQVDPSVLGSVVLAVTNPRAAAGGRDAEPDDHVRELAPHRFRASQYRAVRAEDYDKAATTLPWVQRAGTRFRWTGSWLSVSTSVDPRGTASVPVDRMVELSMLLDRYRLAGYEAFAAAPRYASLDLVVTVCARPEAFRGDVQRAVLTALDASVHVDGTSGFFHPDRFSFGVALERSALAAAIQHVPGVDGVVELSYRRRGHTPGFVSMTDAVEVAGDEIVRVDNDPDRPDSGSVRVRVMGGK